MQDAQRFKLLVPVLIIAGFSFFYFSITSNDAVVGYLSDDAIYLLMAELYSPWNSAINPVLNLIREESYFPPLYPLLMGLIGVNSNTPELASTITVSFLLISLVIYGIWIWLETKSLIISIILPSITVLLPSSIILAQGLWSEFLFMIFLYGLFIINSQKEIDYKLLLISSLIIGLASLTRSIALAMIISYWLLLLFKKPDGYRGLMIISAIPFAYLFIIKQGVSSNPGYFSIFINLINEKSYYGLFSFFLTQLVLIKESFYWLFAATNFSYLPKLFASFIYFVFFIFFFIGFLSRLKKLKLDTLFLTVYMGIIILWPYQDLHYISRILYPILPLLIFYMWLGTQSITNSKITARLQSAVLLLFIFIIAFPASSNFITRAYADIDTELKPFKRDRRWLLASNENEGMKTLKLSREIILSLPLVKKYVPINECIYALQTPMVMLYTNRISSIYPENPDENFNYKNHTCRFYLAMPLTTNNNSAPPYYPLQHIFELSEFEIIPLKTSSYKEEAIIYLVKRN